MHRANSSSADKWDTATFNVHNKPALAMQITGLSFLQHIAELHKGVSLKELKIYTAASPENSLAKRQN